VTTPFWHLCRPRKYEQWIAAGRCSRAAVLHLSDAGGCRHTKVLISLWLMIRCRNISNQNARLGPELVIVVKRHVVQVGVSGAEVDSLNGPSTPIDPVSAIETLLTGQV
jgi:hypothetical protein